MVMIPTQTRTHYIHSSVWLQLNLHPRYFHVDPFFTRFFLLLCQDHRRINDGSWDENKTGILLLGERRATQKCLGIRANECGAFSFGKGFFFLLSGIGADKTLRLEECKKTQKSIYQVKKKDWAHHHTGIHSWIIFISIFFIAGC